MMYQQIYYATLLTCIYVAPGTLDTFLRGSGHLRGGRTNQTGPRHGLSGGSVKQQAESHFKTDVCHGVWGQPGVPSEGPRSGRKFTQTCIRNMCSMEREREAPFWIENHFHLIET